MAKIFSKSDDFKSEYCCTVVKIGEVKPIEGSDFLGQTMVNGESIVVRKDQVKEGDILIYSSNETQLNKEFLSKNNLFELSSRDLNDNYYEVDKLVREGKTDEAKKMVGFFNHTGRVRMIRLRGVPSMGYLFTLNEMIKYRPQTKDINLEEMVGEDFDTVCDELFVKAYVPFVPQVKERSKSLDKKRQKKADRFDRMVKGEFMLHYSTDPLPKCIHRIKPTDCVSVTCKLHGTSFVMANVKVKQPIRLPFFERMFNKFVDVTGWFKEHRVTDYELVYGNVYSSRTVIKNQYINKEVGDGFYGVDVWAEYNNLLKAYIPEGMTVYGEICGYVTDSDKMIQKEYDYGCGMGKNFLMPYRITTTNADGSKYEWEVMEVKEWTEKLIKDHPELKERIHVIDLLYHGTLANLYPEISTEEHWHENVLEAMRNDKEHFGMELAEPLCKRFKKSPREGICVRKNGNNVECFKLKCYSFLSKESQEITNGNVDDEMLEVYS